MLEWLQGLEGPQFATALLWALTALILLVVVLVVARLIGSMTFGTFVAGGRNRKTRLAVMDATAVDSHRRLVLIRRDDTEHLLLIGGPTDVVVERDIKLSQPRRPALTGHPGPETLPHPKPRLAEPPTPGPRQPEPVPARPPAPVQAPPRPTAPPPAAPAARRQAAPQAVRSPEQVKPPPPPARPADTVLPPSPPHRPPPAVIPPAPPPHASNGTEASAMARAGSPVARPSSTSLDETLLRELEVTFDSDPSPNPPRMPIKPPELTLDEEMTKLLGELSSHKRS